MATYAEVAELMELEMDKAGKAGIADSCAIAESVMQKIDPENSCSQAERCSRLRRLEEWAVQCCQQFGPRGESTLSMIYPGELERRLGTSDLCSHPKCWEKVMHEPEREDLPF
jgi:hypothetical protein